MKTTMVDEALSLIDAIIELPEEELMKARGLWKKLAPLLGDLWRIAQNEKKPTLLRLRPSVESAAARLLKSISASTGPLGKEWELFAKNDLEDLKDCLMEVRDIITKNLSLFKRLVAKASLSEKIRLDPEALINELHNVGAISDRTWLLLTARGILPNDTKDPEVSQTLERMAQLFLELERVRG